METTTELMEKTPATIPLKSCPFCGNDKPELECSPYLIGAYKVRVVCHKCRAQGGYVTTKEHPKEQGGYESEPAKEAAAKWNTRTTTESEGKQDADTDHRRNKRKGKADAPRV